ncbi:alanine--tRNA ligase, partial [Candidatus Giovannonibacteria bacterium]|nr:alanine--tRNA ligase [Candidatus Giovannonibacteria bacterium]
EYYCAKDQSLTPLLQKGVDVGWGFERLAMIVQNKKNIFEMDLLSSYLELLPKELPEKTKRIIVDHLRGSAFLLADGVRPSNKEAGYILRRLMRRVLVYENIYKIPAHIFDAILHDLIHEYGGFYPELVEANEAIREEFKNERERFSKTLEKGLKEFNKFVMTRRPRDKWGRIGVFHDQKILYGDDAFYLYQTFGFPLEVMRDLCKEADGVFDDDGFDNALKKHQEVSRAGIEKKFGGHGLLLDTGELKAANEEELKKVTRLHTATHLLQAALRKVLGDGVEQRGSDITSERTRFDFLFPRKLTKEELQKIETLVNYAIEKNFPVIAREFPLEEAKKSGALFFFKGHYPPKVKVYTVGNGEETFSKELCGGPHVSNTGEIGEFRIIKEEASSAGVRRIRAVVK